MWKRRGCYIGCVIKLDKIKLKRTTLKRVGVTHIVEKMLETRLKLFEYEERRLVNFVVKKTNKVEGHRSLKVWAALKIYKRNYYKWSSGKWVAER